MYGWLRKAGDTDGEGAWDGDEEGVGCSTSLGSETVGGQSIIVAMTSRAGVVLRDVRYDWSGWVING